MAIALGTGALGAISTTTPYTTSINPAAAPNGVCVLIEQNASSADNITTVTYGGVPLTERRFAFEATEAGAVYLYWAGGVAFPGGAQNVVINKTTAATNTRAAIWTMTCAAGQQVSVDTDTTGGPGPAINPSWSMVTVDALTVCLLVIHSGLQTMTSTPQTSPAWTLGPGAGFEDIGNQGRGWASRTAASAGEQSPGWIAATSEDFVGASVAFKEAPLTAPPVADPTFHQRSPRPIEQSNVAGPYAIPAMSSQIVQGG